MASNARKESPTRAYDQYSSQLIQTRGLTETSHIDLSQAVKPSQIEALKDNLTSQRGILERHMAIDGIRRAARSEEGDVSYDLLVTHAALLVEIDAVLTAIDLIALPTVPTSETADLKTKLESLQTEITVV